MSNWATPLRPGTYLAFIVELLAKVVFTSNPKVLSQSVQGQQGFALLPKTI